MADPIDIPRAIAEERRIIFSHAEGLYLYYDTAFGEQFAIPIWLTFNGIQRNEPAANWTVPMQYHNDNLPPGGA